jgi:hypothetical protein
VTIEDWLEAALADADRKRLPDLKPLLRGLAESTRRLRSADWNDDASGRRPGAVPRRTPDKLEAGSSDPAARKDGA